LIKIYVDNTKFYGSHINLVDMYKTNKRSRL